MTLPTLRDLSLPAKVILTSFLTVLALEMLVSLWQVEKAASLSPRQLAEIYSREGPAGGIEGFAPQAGEREITLGEIAQPPHRVTLAQLVQDAHVHLFSHGVIALIGCGILFLTTLSDRTKIWLTLITFGGGVIDYLGMFLVHFAAKPFVVLILLGGAFYSLGFTVIFVRSLYELWMAKSHPTYSGGIRL